MPRKKTIEKTTKKVAPKKAIQHKSDNLKVDMYNISGQVESKLSLPRDIFGAKVNGVLMAQAIRVYHANQRQGTISTKTRSEVTGSTRKIYRQKGTGRARHGDIKAPIFIGGGVAHGPHPRDFSLQMPKTMKRRALFSALSQKLKDGNILAINGLEKIGKKTKEIADVLNNLKVMDKKKQKKLLMVLPSRIENLVLAGRNIEGLHMTAANLLNTYEVLNHNKILFLKDAIDTLEKTYLKKEAKN